jgi:hypothetical protein
MVNVKQLQPRCVRTWQDESRRRKQVGAGAGAALHSHGLLASRLYNYLKDQDAPIIPIIMEYGLMLPCKQQVGVGTDATRALGQTQLMACAQVEGERGGNNASHRTLYACKRIQ